MTHWERIPTYTIKKARTIPALSWVTIYSLGAGAMGAAVYFLKYFFR